MADNVRKLYDMAVGRQPAPAGPVVHVRIQGRSRDIAMVVLDIRNGMSDAAIREAVAQFMELPFNQLRNSVVERHENGNITVRPEAVFG